MRSRTMLYVDPEELKALQAEARAQGVSLAELLRRLVRAYLEARRRPTAPPSRSAYLKLVGLGASGRSDIAARHDAYLGDAVRR